MKKKAKQPAPPVPFGSVKPVIGNRALLDAEVERRKKLVGDRQEAERHLQRPTRDFMAVRDVMAQVLARHNFTLADMDKAEEQAEAEARRISDEAKRGLYERGWTYKCPARYREDFHPIMLPEGVDPDKVNTVLRWEPNSDGKGLFVMGDTGRGKTRAVFAMLRRHFLLGRTIEWRDGIGFAADCSRAMAEAVLIENWLRSVVKPDIFFIDDIAKRFTPATQEGFFAVLDRRVAAKKPIIITSNLTGAEVQSLISIDRQLAEPLRRRLREHCEVVLF